MWLKDLFKKDPIETTDGFLEWIISEKSKQLAIKKKAINHAVDLIARTISKCEIQVFRYDKSKKKIISKKDEIYYKLNVKTNKNEYSTSFFYNVITKLLEDEEALIIEINNELFLADSFKYSNSIIYEKNYHDIILKDNDNNEFSLDRTFTASEVIHLSIGSSKINECLDDYYKEFGDLINASYLFYQSNNYPKWRITTPGNQPAIIDTETKKPISYEKYKQKILDGLFSKDERILLISEFLKLENLNGNKQVSSDDIVKLEKKWSDEVASSFNIPLDVFYGNKTDKSTGTNDFISFAIMPILRILEDGMNGTIIKKDDYLRGDRIHINKLNMKHFDIFDSANALDKLFGDGFSHNDLRSFLDIPNLDEAWADEHNVTKNYGSVDKKDSTKGGDDNE